jgi:hypothetical protein
LDKTKKFAILHKLFHGKNSIRDFTTLLLTHDIEPAIDVVRTETSGQFQATEPRVHFLSSREGRVEEKQIQRADIMTFSQVCDANIASSADDVIKCIYLRRRYEVHGDIGTEYDLLSSLLHLREFDAVPEHVVGHGQFPGRTGARMFCSPRRPALRYGSRGPRWSVADYRFRVPPRECAAVSQRRL